MMNQCGNCHQDEAETFFDTYHGKVSRLGSEGAAKCYDCHGTHDILPPANPEPRTSRARTWSRPAPSATRARTAGSPAT